MEISDRLEKVGHLAKLAVRIDLLKGSLRQPLLVLPIFVVGSTEDGHIPVADQLLCDHRTVLTALRSREVKVV